MTVATRRTPVGAAVSAPAMSVLSFRPSAGCHAGVDRWYEDLELIVAGFSGYLGTEVLAAGPASEAERRERTVVHRFASTGQLETWLGSAERTRILDRATYLLDVPAKQQILVGDLDREGVALVRSYRPEPADEAAFLAWHQRAVRVQRPFPGFRGSELVRPVAGGQETWTVVLRFASQLQLDHWLTSPEHERLAAEVRHALVTPATTAAAHGRSPLRGGLRPRRRASSAAA